tara:strand:- start:352 stop:777 length:426 start_codon:yes stop_codon:yes gene_type:complete
MFYYFARINSLNIVTEVQRVEDYNSTDYLGNFSEVVATEFCAKIFGHLPGDRWIRTAKDGSIRRQFAGKNHTYDEENDRFLPPKPHGAWVFNETTYEYEAPHAAPELTDEQRADSYYYQWEDNEYLLDNSNGWVLKQVEGN